jgi:hypothetical protein
MNREIKFKFWCTSENRFVTGISIHGNGEISCPDDISGTDICKDVIPLQYTGCKDCSGKEIYEGDIVKFINWSDEPNREIIFIDGTFTYKNTFYDWDGLLYTEKCVIVGNIFENSDLIK